MMRLVAAFRPQPGGAISPWKPRRTPPRLGNIPALRGFRCGEHWRQKRLTFRHSALGDGKTLLGFDFSNQSAIENLAGFTVECKPQGQTPYYLLNEL